MTFGNTRGFARRPSVMRLHRFLLSIVGAVLVVFPGAGAASAATLHVLEIRVGASPPVVGRVAGVHECVSAGQRWGNAPPRTETVVGCCVAAKSGTPLYRGVTEGHHAFDDALQGTAMPGDLLGHRDGVLHSAGMTENSVLTSWTTDRALAERFATNGATGRGVILETTLEQQAHRTVQGLDLGESEVLVRGIVTGCRVSGCG